MSRGSEDASPALADVVYQLASLGGHVIYEVRQGRLTLTDLQAMLGVTQSITAEIERAIEVATPIDLTRRWNTCIECQKPTPAGPSFGVRCGDCMDPGGAAP